MDSDMQRHLNGYKLPNNELWELKKIIERRYKARYWENLSPEGQAAMRGVIDNDSGSSEQYSHGASASSTKAAKTGDKSKNKSKGSHDPRRKRTISFTDTFKKSGSSRLDGDITDDNFNSESLRKRGIGGKLESAMETVEIVKHGEDTSLDASAIEETATLNSVEKCLVWMEVHNDDTYTGPSEMVMPSW